ncbi:MAG: LysR family transcriptional regulator [Acidimicrobiia bacterium]
MDLHQLRCAVAVADHGSFTKAADALHMTQPALSYVINRLEAELGTLLFERLRRGVAITAAGRALLEPARMTLAEADRTRAAVTAVTGLVAGSLHLGSVRLTMAIVADLVTAFHDRHPDVTVVVHEPLSDTEVIECVRDGRFDLAVIRASAVPSDLSSVEFVRHETVVVGPDAIAPGRGPLTTERLAQLPLIAQPQGTPGRNQIDLVFADASVHPHVVMECANHEMILELVARGVGVAITARNHPLVADRAGVWMRSFVPARMSALAVVHRRGRPSPAVEALRALALEVLT